ncbi:MAG: hypothetical protein U0L10_06060 [Lachnospiraceae bacterium]|nr:hypothetical protein [Lachnospiraceae bacterium]HAL59138.1 hypothetical protein [Sarcina sp.]
MDQDAGNKIKKVKGENIMKKICRRLLSIVLVLCMLSCFAPLTAEAKDKYHTTVHTLKQKTWVTVKGVQFPDNYEAEYHVYKMSVPAGGYVRLYINVNKAVKAHLRPALYKKVVQNKIFFNTDRLIEFSQVTTTNYVSLEKGDYYFYAAEGTKVKWDFQKMPHPNNYCKAKAAVQPSGKNKVLYFDYGYEHAQWFKVTLSKEQRISAFINALDNAYEPGMLILNNKLRMVKTSRIENYGAITLRTGLLPKGTYYIRVSRSDNYFEDESDTLDDGRIYSFTWKKY